MNKRIRKKRMKRTLNNLLAAYDELMARRERVLCEALRDVADAHGKSEEELYAARRRCMDTIAFLAFSGPPPSDYTPVSAPSHG